jgi:hypothetical protein
MRASIEYLFAGLSVVSTPSIGARDYFVDDEFCIICEPDPRSIREECFWQLTRGQTILRFRSMKEFSETVSRLVLGAKRRFRRAGNARR